MRIELFFGAGGAFFNMPQVKYHVLNDIDDDVTNLYELVLKQKDRLIFEIERMPASSSLVKKWKRERPTDPIEKALRFLLLSNFTYLGKGDTLRIGLDNSKAMLLSKIDDVFRLLCHAKITNYDFRDVIQKISFSNKLLTKKDAFVYLDPVYFETEYFYTCPKWTVTDTMDCFELMKNCGIKCAMSEFNHPFVLSEAKKHGFEVVYLMDRKNMKNRRVEILILNYQSETNINLFSHA